MIQATITPAPANPLIVEPECIKVPTETLELWAQALSVLRHPHVPFCEDFETMREAATRIQMRGIDALHCEIKKTINRNEHA